MLELGVLEAKLPVRPQPVIDAKGKSGSARLAPFAGWVGGPTFSRVRDILAANLNELLDRAEEPARMIRLTIVEMEETLVEVRATAARSIAAVKEMECAAKQLNQVQEEWTAKAEFALTKARDDLAKAALVERRRARDIAESLRGEVGLTEQVLRGYEQEIGKLQRKLSEARARQRAIAARFDSARSRAKAREILDEPRAQDAFASFEFLERRADLAEVRCDVLGMGSLEDEMHALNVSEQIDAELQAMKADLNVRPN